jgi:hypothetical protein
MTDDEFYEDLVRMGVTVEYDWCTSCSARACDEGMNICHMCAAARTNP